MKYQKGFSLVEVMIGLTIGIVLLLGLTMLFGSMRQTSIRTQQLSQIQNQQKMAVYFLRNAVANAGYYTGIDNSTPPQPVDPSTVFPARVSSSNPTFASVGQTLYGTGTGVGTDTISVRFLANSAIPQQGCTAALTSGHRYIDTFSVSGGVLQCVEVDESTGTSTTNNLVSGIASMSVSYGVDENGNGSVTAYHTATEVTNGSFWPVAIFNNPANGFYGVQGVKTVEVTFTFTNTLATDVVSQASNPGFLRLVATFPYMANI